MSRESRELWGRAEESLRAAEVVLPVSPDAAASRAYYAAFYAVSALFAERGRTFKRHSAVEAAVHRDLVRSGRWSATLGSHYSRLFALRQTGDYGLGEHVTAKDGAKAISVAGDILAAVSVHAPDLFPLRGGHE